MNHKLLTQFMLAFFALAYSNSFAQDTPCTATSLTINAACNSTTADLTGLTNSTVSAPSCASYSGPDIWFSFTVPASGDVTIDVAEGSITDGGMSIYSGSSCSSLTEITCNDDGGTGLMPQITSTTLTPGQTIYIRLWEYGGGTGTMDVCVIDNNAVVAAPSNDDCSTAISLTHASACTAVSGTITGATASSQPSCGTGTPNDDVWYSFVATDDTATITRNANFDSAMEVLDGCSGTSILCVDSETPQQLIGLTVGQTYFIRVYNFFSSSTANGTFDICVTAPATVVSGTNNTTCGSLAPICTSTGLSFTAQAGGITDVTVDQPGNNYDCLGTSPDPSWFYLEVNNSGDINMSLTAVDDIDYVIWGPFSNLATAQSQCGNLGNGGASGTVVDCSYSPTNLETPTITGAQAGDVYIMLITNYAGIVQTIDLTQTSGSGSTNCNIVTNPPCNANAGTW